MHIVIDGYNYIFEVYNFKNTEMQKARESLILHLQDYVSRKKVKMEVVFDSPGDDYLPSSNSQNGVKVVFYPDADEYIKKLVKDNPNPCSILVVTSDGEILREVRRNGAGVKSPSEFDAFLNKNKRKMRNESSCDEKPSSETISEGEVNLWLEEFKNRRNCG